MDFFAQSLTNNDFIKTIAGVIFWVGGYAAAPLIFMATMGIFRNIAGMGGGLLKQARGKLNEASSRQFKANREAYKSKKYEDKNIAAQRRANVAVAGRGLTARSRAARAKARSDNRFGFANAMAEDTDYASWKGNDELNRIVAETTGTGREFENRLKTNLENTYGKGDARVAQGLAATRQMNQRYGTDAVRQASFISAMAGGTQWKGAGSGGSAKDAWALATAISGGDRAIESQLVAGGRNAAMNAGRADLGAGGFSDTARLAGGTLSGDMGGALSERDYYRSIIKTQGPGVLTHSSMKGHSAEIMSDEYGKQVKERVEALAASGAPDADKKIAQELASAAGVLDTMSSSSPENAQHFADSLMGVKTSAFGGGDVSIHEAIEAYRGDADFGQMRREYANAYGQQASSQQAAAQAAQNATGGLNNTPPTSFP